MEVILLNRLSEHMLLKIQQQFMVISFLPKFLIMFSRLPVRIQYPQFPTQR